MLVSNYFDLVKSLKDSVPITIKNVNFDTVNYTGIVRSIEAEDASGRCWNIKLLVSNEICGNTMTLFVRTP